MVHWVVMHCVPLGFYFYFLFPVSGVPPLPTLAAGAGAPTPLAADARLTRPPAPKHPRHPMPVQPDSPNAPPPPGTLCPWTQWAGKHDRRGFCARWVTVSNGFCRCQWVIGQWVKCTLWVMTQWGKVRKCDSGPFAQEGVRNDPLLQFECVFFQNPLP